MKLVGKALNIVSLCLAFIWTFVSAFLVATLYRPFPRLGLGAHQRWGKIACKLMGVRVKYLGLEHIPDQGGFILAPNHESLWDILVLAALPLPIRWIAKKELKQVPLVGWAMQAMRCFFVSRDRSGKDVNTMKSVEEGLRQGAVVVIFPEGTRTRTGELLPLKKGAFCTAQNAGVPLIPVGITGTRLIAAPGEVPAKRGHDVVVRFGAPVLVSPQADLVPVMENFRGKLLELLAKDRNTKPMV